MTIEGRTNDEGIQNINLNTKLNENGYKTNIADDNQSSIQEWKYKDYKFPSALPDPSNNSITIYSINKKKDETPKLSVDEVFNIFGKKRATTSVSKSVLIGNPFMNETLHNEPEIMYNKDKISGRKIRENTSAINISVTSSYYDKPFKLINNGDYLKPQTSMNDRLCVNKNENYKSLLASTPLTQKMSQTQYQSLRGNNKYFKDQGYKKGEFFANLMIHLEKSPMNASKSIKTPCIRLNMEAIRPIYWQQINEKQSTKNSPHTIQSSNRNKRRTISVIERSQKQPSFTGKRYSAI